MDIEIEKRDKETSNKVKDTFNMFYKRIEVFINPNEKCLTNIMRIGGYKC